METTPSSQAATATATIAFQGRKDDAAPPPPSSSLAPPCLAAVRAESAALAREEAERAACAAADAARWDPDAWAATADKVLLPFVNPRGNRSGALERALLDRDDRGRPAPSSSPPPPPRPPPPPAIASVGDVVIVAAEIPDDLSVLRVAPQQQREGAAATARGGGGGSGDGAAAASLPSASAASAAAVPAPPSPAPSSSRWSGDPTRGNSQACWVGTVRQLEAASGRALLGWLAPKRAKRSGAGAGAGAGGRPNGGGGERPLLLSPVPSSLPSSAAAAGDDDGDAPPSASGGGGGGGEDGSRDAAAADDDGEDLSRLPWVPAPGLPADWLDASSAGILSVCRCLEKGTALIPAAALAAAGARLTALVAHDVARAERARRKTGQQQ